MNARLEGVSFHYRDRRDVLVEVDLDVQAGVHTVLAGPSGAGKTTALCLLAGEVRPHAGMVLWNDRPLPHTSPRERRALRLRAGFLTQFGDLVPSLTVESNVLLGHLGSAAGRARLQRWHRHDHRVRQILERLGIEAIAHQRVDEVSGGQRQRVAVARLLVHRPDLVLADEPTGSIDRVSSSIVIAALDELVADGCALITATHEAELIRSSDRVVGLRDGRIRFGPSTPDAATLEGLYAVDTGPSVSAGAQP